MGDGEGEDCVAKLFSVNATTAVFRVNIYGQKHKKLSIPFALGIKVSNQVFRTTCTGFLPVQSILGPLCSGCDLIISPYLFSCHSKPFTIFYIIPMFYCFCLFIHAVLFILLS